MYYMYTTGHTIVVADILKDLVNLESDVTGIQSPNLGHHATYSLKRKKIIFLSLDGTLLLHYKIFFIFCQDYSMNIIVTIDVLFCPNFTWIERDEHGGWGLAIVIFVTTFLRNAWKNCDQVFLNQTPRHSNPILFATAACRLRIDLFSNSFPNITQKIETIMYIRSRFLFYIHKCTKTWEMKILFLYSWKE